MSQLIPINPATKVELEAEFAAAREELLAAEAELAEEQAAVNAFRMHCRLLLGDLIDEVMALRTEKQVLLTRLNMAQDGMTMDDEDEWDGMEEPTAVPPIPPEEPLLLTETPRDKAAEKRLYRELARRFHPDLASTTVERAYATSIMASVNKAYASGDVNTLRDLAGEADPTLMQEIERIESREIRKLRKLIFGCQRRQRKVQQQFKALHEENTARLWRRVKRLEAEGLDYWQEIQEELTREIAETQSTIAELSQMLNAE